jgi:hypothetical protein
MRTAPLRTVPPHSVSFRRRSRVLQIADKSRPTRGPRHGGMRLHSQTFKTGDPVAQSGIYEVIHASAHRKAHEVVMIRGDAFPACDTCKRDVRFKLVRTAPYIFQDEDFEEPK